MVKGASKGCDNWKHVEARTKKGKVMKIRVGSQLSQEEVRAYKELTDEFDDIFAWLYKDLKGISPDMVEHKIPPIPGGRPIRHKEKRINPRLQLLVRAELECLLRANFIRLVEIMDWVSPMVLVKKKNGKLRLCMDYQKLNACTQKDHFPLPFILFLLEEVGGHVR